MKSTDAATERLPRSAYKLGGVGLSQILGPPGSCFATPATYRITFPHPDYNWHVISTKK